MLRLFDCWIFRLFDHMIVGLFENRKPFYTVSLQIFASYLDIILVEPSKNPTIEKSTETF